MIQVSRRFVGTVHFFQGPSKSNPVALYARKQGEEFLVAPVIEPWNTVVGKGPTINKAAGDFEVKWKAQPIPAEHYTGPHWEEGIKAEKPAPPKPAAAATPAAGRAPPAPAAGTPAAAAGAASSAPPASENPSP